MDNSQMPQDSAPTMEEIKAQLQNIMDLMNGMESDRMLPDGHPMKKPMAMPTDMAPSDAEMSGTSMEDPAEGDQSTLDSLMGDADKADSDGMMAEDHENALPPELLDAVKKKKASM